MDQNDLYEKVGKLSGSFDALNSRVASIDRRMEEMAGKLDQISLSVGGLKMRVATISSGVGAVITLAITFVWRQIFGG